MEIVSDSLAAAKAKPRRKGRPAGPVVAASGAAHWPAWTDRPLGQVVTALALASPAPRKGGAR